MLADLTWPLASIDRAFETLAAETGLTLRRDPLPPVPDFTWAEQRRDLPMLDDLLESWLRASSRARGLELESTGPTYSHLAAFFQRGGPALILLFGAEQDYLLALVGYRAGQVRLLTPSGQTVSQSTDEILHELSAAWQRANHGQSRFVEGMGLSYEAQETLRRAYFEEQIAPQEAGYAWMLQSPMSAPLRQLLHGQNLYRSAFLLLSCALLSAVLSMLAWYLVGSDALNGVVDSGRLLAWALLLLTTVPLNGLATYAQGQFALRVSVLIKRVLLRGFINMPSDQVRIGGLGRQLALVSESATLEQFALQSTFVLIISLGNLSSSFYLFWLVQPARHLILLLGCWLALALLGSFLLYRQRGRWTAQRLGLTEDLISKMNGHRTRRIQQSPEHWHDGEDEKMVGYWQASKLLDLEQTLLLILPRAWLLISAIALVPLLLSASTTFLLAAMIGLLLSYNSLQMLLSSLGPLLQFRIAQRVLQEPMDRAQQVDERPVTFVSPSSLRLLRGPLIELYDVVYRFRAQGRPVLRGCSLQIRSGEHILLEGGSGGGKTTLASLISGLRTPESGLVLIADCDQHTLHHEAWSRLVASAPQFHENHIFSNTLAFNLLMGRRWPPSQQDLQEATALCDELDLGPLLARMPNHIHQLVGETGWQLSHGEKSRVFIARALLQRAELLVLDESFGTLDPETLEICMATVFRHSKTLLVIAHP